MTQGFLHAGAERVVVSLWNVPDQVTSELMERFYHGLLLEGLAPAAALREAQEAIRRQPGRSAPYYWAGFLLQGEWRGLRSPLE
jgi:CHAT domain-containing protein